MEEAGLISAAVRAAPEVEATVRAPRPSGEARDGRVAPSPGPLRTVWQIAVAVVASVVGFAASLLSLLSGFPSHLALGALAAVPAIALVLALAVAARPAGREPDIHDRYLDYILGLALLGLATAAMIFLPGALSVFFWSWRLDTLALPIFLAGSVALLCGSRTLWRFKLSIAFLLLAWPLPYVAAGLTGTAATGLFLGVVGAVLVTATVVRGRRVYPPPRHSPTRGEGGIKGEGEKRRVGGGRFAVAVVLAAAGVTAVADHGIGASSRLLQPDGRPALSTATRLASVIDGLSLVTAGGPPGLPTLGPASHSTSTYATSQARLAPTGAIADGATIVDRIAPGDPRQLQLSPSSLARLHGYHLRRGGLVDLGSGLSGHLEAYAAPDGTATMVLLWWDWPVRSGSSVERERIMVRRLVAGENESAAMDQVLRFSRNLLSLVRPGTSA